MTRLIKLIISLGLYSCRQLWQWVLQARGKTPPGTCTILYYHDITAQDRHRFARQMNNFLRLARPIEANFTSALEDGIHYGAITFDDGFQGVIENALPELVQRHIPATLFIPTAYLGKHAGWISNPDRHDCSGLIVTCEQLRSLPSNLISVGSHTATHSRLSLLKEEDAKRELEESREALLLIVGREISLLSFPYGAYNERTLELARQAGYMRVFGILPGFCKPGEYLARRVLVSPTDWRLEFRLKLLGAYSWLPLGFAIKRTLKYWIGQILHPAIAGHH